LKCPKVVPGDDGHLECCDVSPVSIPGHDLHHLKTRVSQSNMAPSKVRQLHFTDTRPFAHQTGMEDHLPSVSHDFVNSPTKAITLLESDCPRRGIAKYLSPELELIVTGHVGTQREVHQSMSIVHQFSQMNHRERR
jgi:hypothetical protein